MSKVNNPGEGTNITELKEKTIDELTKLAKVLKVEGARGLRKQDLIFAILQAQTEKTGLIFGEGVQGFWKFSLTALVFSVHLTTVTCRDLTIYMFRLPR
jgi:transcription termination factor Rho